METKRPRYPPTSPQWDANPDQVQLALFLLNVLVNAHMWHLPDGAAELDDPLKRVTYLAALLLELERATRGELPPTEDDADDDDSPFKRFVERLLIPD